MMIVAMFGFAGLVFADARTPVKEVIQGQKAMLDLEAEATTGDSPLAPSSALAAAPANDTCAGAFPLSLGTQTRGTTVDANNDYQSPATTACFAGGGQAPTNSPGRDIVFSFRAPADGKYSFRMIQYNVSDAALTSQNAVLYLTDDCSTPGEQTCITGANRSQLSGTSSTGFSNNRSEAIPCHPMTAGQTVYLIVDDGAPGTCSLNSHACFEDSDCLTGQTCLPALNAGHPLAIDPVLCNEEVEPNNTTADASPIGCFQTGSNDAPSVARCYLGTRAGQACTRSTFLDQLQPDSNMRCSITNAQCSVNVATGIGTCGAGEGICQQLTDLDCDPRCDSGPNAGKSCTTQLFCNPVSDQGATCAGTCQLESVCINTATGEPDAIPVACTPVCTGSTQPGINGRYCSGLSGCPGAGTCTTTVLVPNPGGTCVAGQTCGRQYNEGDVDYFALGVVPVGHKIFVAIDGKSTTDNDNRLRITTADRTLQFDDDDGTTRQGQSSAVIAGTLGTGEETFAKVSRTNARASGPYEVYSIIRPDYSTAEVEDDSGPIGNDSYYYWPFAGYNANYATGGGWVRGTIDYPGDSDCFKFIVNKGQNMEWYGDGNPRRNAGGVGLVGLIQTLTYDAEPSGVSNVLWGSNPRRNIDAATPQPSTSALSPSVTSAGLHWRASYTGMLEVCAWDTGQNLPGSSGGGSPVIPAEWAMSLGIDCGPIRPAGPGSTTTEVTVTKSGPLDCVYSDEADVDPVCVPHVGTPVTGSVISFQISVTNSSSDIAQEVRLVDTLDPNMSYMGLSVNDTFPSTAKGNTSCITVPSPGTADQPIDCTNWSMYPGQTTNYWVQVQINNCISGGPVANRVEVSTVSTDPNTNDICLDPIGNPVLCDSTGSSFLIAAAPNDGCSDLLCDTNSCSLDLCTDNDTCVAGVCVSGAAPSCEDNNVCTDDDCDPAIGCVNDSSQNGDLCDDFDACTSNTCNAVSGCQYPTIVCDDGDACTTDTCDTVLGCVYTAVVCTASDQCHVAGTCDSGTGLCSNPNAADGTTCNDGDAGTDPDTCQAGVCVGTTPGCDIEPKPKSSGYYKKLCKNGIPKPSHTDALTDADAACVGQLTDTFAGITTATEICEVFDHSGQGHDSNGPNAKECQKGEDELMGLALNICRQRICLDQAVDSACGAGHDSHNRVPTTVSASLGTTDAILSDPARGKATCQDAKCLAKEINNGKGIHHVSLTIAKAPANATRLNWESPVMDDGSGEGTKYTIWRRALNSETPYVKMTDTTAFTWVDNNAGTDNWEYEVTFTVQP